MTNNLKPSHIIKLDLWGGNQTYDMETETYSINRDCGLFSNITIAMYGVLKLHYQGLSVKHIKLMLNEYIDETTDIYSSLFIKNLDVLNLNAYSNEEICHSLRYGEPNPLGLGREKSHIVLSLYNNICNTYFQYNNISDLVNNIVAKYSINYENTVFIWARKTDKTHELAMPMLETYNNILWKNNLLDHTILLQTDDSSIVEMATNQYKHIKVLYEMPFSQGNKGFHNHLSHILDETFVNTHGYDKMTYLKKMLAMTVVASRCKHFVCYPGNLTTFIPILKNTFDNCFCFKNSKELL